MNVLLIQAPMPEKMMIKEIADLNRCMPLQLGYIASVLRQSNYNVNILDLSVMSLTISDFTKEYLNNEFCYDIVGIGCTTVTINNAIKIADLIKEYFPPTKIILGGPHVTFQSKEILDTHKSVDYIVRGEGEYTTLDLVETIKNKCSPNKVLGITYRDAENIIFTPNRAPIANLDELPFPARDLFLSEQYTYEGIISSRGCPRKCIFCVAGAMSNFSYRIRSPKNIVDELRQLQGNKIINFYDNTFSGLYRISLAICDEIIKSKIDILWTCELRVDNVKPELFKKLYSAGCRTVQFGVESGSNQILKSIKKGIKVKQVREAVDMAIQSGLNVSCSFTLGHPNDTPETIDNTFTLMKDLKNKGAKVVGALLVPYPGTELYNDRDQLGVVVHDENWDTYHPGRPIISTSFLTREMLGQYYLHSKLFVED